MDNTLHSLGDSWATSVKGQPLYKGHSSVHQDYSTNPFLTSEKKTTSFIQRFHCKTVITSLRFLIDIFCCIAILASVWPSGWCGETGTVQREEQSPPADAGFSFLVKSSKSTAFDFVQEEMKDTGKARK